MDPDGAFLRRRRRRRAQEDVIARLIIIAAAPVIWQLGHLDHRRPGRLKLVTATIVAVSLVSPAVVLAY